MAIFHGSAIIVRANKSDTLYHIARKLGSNPEWIERVNHLHRPFREPGVIFGGDILVVPTILKQQGVSLANPSFLSLELAASMFNMEKEALKSINSGNWEDRDLKVPALIYMTELSDTLEGIALRFGLNKEEILSLNKDRPGFSAVNAGLPGYAVIVPVPCGELVVLESTVIGSKLREYAVIYGKAKRDAGRLVYRITDDNGELITSDRELVTGQENGNWQSFGAEIYFDRKPSTHSGILSILAENGKSLSHKVYFL
ncbi:LysM peptidoglycan-binding domain-containing protein [Metabacillus lacus]|uniref:LysM peptidoglycan-binding domain-containing protein n=1 Tax=Metabacillus lacus TaxID=1983721 RepID=UPI0014786B85|nr:LysM peptidoglycan-binding domain-containing protein [Metabacillus lacus]